MLKKSRLRLPATTETATRGEVRDEGSRGYRKYNDLRNNKQLQAFTESLHEAFTHCATTNLHPRHRLENRSGRPPLSMLYLYLSLLDSYRDLALSELVLECSQLQSARTSKSPAHQNHQALQNCCPEPARTKIVPQEKSL